VIVARSDECKTVVLKWHKGWLVRRASRRRAAAAAAAAAAATAARGTSVDAVPRAYPVGLTAVSVQPNHPCCG
jgi:cobalamin biosynthesis protein CbiD